MSDEDFILVKYCKTCDCETERYKGGRCKPCARRDAKNWAADNKEKVKQNCKLWNSKNAEYVKAQKAKNYLENVEKNRQRASDYYKAHRDTALAYANNRRKETLDASIQRAREWRRIYPQKSMASTLDWQRRNPEKVSAYKNNRRAKTSGALGLISSDLKSRLFSLQKGKCACCGLPLGDNYHLDHIMPLALGGTNTDDNIQLLRQRCNNQKHKKHPIDFMQERGFLL